MAISGHKTIVERRRKLLGSKRRRNFTCFDG